ncbi:MAG: nucleotide exchange factor GrpE [Acidobacteria bacterium]|nr:MAG: nucleotide exchange factor GrpE [Acidobacteriota bacterium]REK02584.1 MAG: nucleotide exchange factor GrpE [Acidobacteriota bacterium]REK13613.1 MAG: nucleotide exchange factor GrpE [Acidobacteriota bacterium]REK41607.1 MAG: nucleotide exchange factor GrpE [Acidobacteriota bacterium]
MSSEKTSNEEVVDSIDAEDVDSVDDFIRELEAKEKDLHISSDLVIEVGESSVEHDNIHDSFISTDEFEFKKPEKNDKPAAEEKAEKPVPPADDDDDSLEGQIEELMNERDSLMDTLRRQKIDFENYRSRTERDRSNTFKSILGGLAVQILPVIDNLDRALDAFGDPDEVGKTEVNRFIEGIVLVSHQLNEVLSEMGVEPIPSVGESFDPTFHEAVDCVPSADVPPKTVIEELIRGYKIGEKVIRPSMVKVSEAPYEPEAETKESSSESSGEPDEPAE